MLQIKSISKGFELKNGTQKIVLDEPSVRLEDTVIDRPGEYEAGGVEVIYGQTAALVIADNLQIVFVFNIDKSTQFELSQFSPCDVIVFGSSITKLTKSYFNETLEAFDPKVVVISTKADRTEIESIVKVEPTDSGKLSIQSLPEDGREFIVISDSNGI